MTKEEASEIINSYFFYTVLPRCNGKVVNSRKLEEAIKMALEALKEPGQRKGKWICHDAKEGFLIKKYTCSICNYYSGTQKPNFCPNCGAEMEGQDG